MKKTVAVQAAAAALAGIMAGMLPRYGQKKKKSHWMSSIITLVQTMRQSIIPICLRSSRKQRKEKMWNLISGDSHNRRLQSENQAFDFQRRFTGYCV